MEQTNLFIPVHDTERDQHGQEVLNANKKNLGGQAGILLQRLLADGFVIYEDLKRNHGVGYPNSRHSDVRNYFMNEGFDWDNMITKEIINYEGTLCTKVTIHAHSREIVRMFLRSFETADKIARK